MRATGTSSPIEPHQNIHFQRVSFIRSDITSTGSDGKIDHLDEPTLIETLSCWISLSLLQLRFANHVEHARIHSLMSWREADVISTYPSVKKTILCIDDDE